MKKSLFIAEKPSVAQEFARALKRSFVRKDGYQEAEDAIVTWCVGHLVTMSYPDAYDERMKKWSLSTLPFLPKKFLYEVIPGVKKQFQIVSSLLNRSDVEIIYVCTDSGREGEYIYRLVEQMADVKGKIRKRVWIDSQTEEEILRGIREAKDLSEYDHLAEAAYLRAKEDYLMGINFSRLLSLKYGNTISNYLHTRYTVISVGRVMTCVLGMVVRREREIRTFVKTPFYRILSKVKIGDRELEGDFRAVEGSKYYGSPLLYKENGFKKREDAEKVKQELEKEKPITACVDSIERKKEKKNPPLLYNLAELQNDCSKMFKMNPDQTLQTVQELYEKKMVTYPRTDARVLSSAVAKEIYKNISGLKNYDAMRPFAEEVLIQGSYKGSAKTRYVNDKQITDHYAIVPTGQGISSFSSLKEQTKRVYETIARRFLSIFYPPAIYQKAAVVTAIQGEKFFSNVRILESEGYLKVLGGAQKQDQEKQEQQEISCDRSIIEALKNVKKGMVLPVKELTIKEGETKPPKRYSSGSMILAMENAGQLIEDEELRAQIKGSGIGTSATRAEILKKLVSNGYMDLNKKTQTITPTLLGEMIFDVVNSSIRSLLNPELTASWEKGLTYVAEGSVTPEEYMQKLEHFITVKTKNVMEHNYQQTLRPYFDHAANYYKKGSKK